MERIMRRMTGFTCEGAWCAATLDEGNAAPGLLIVSGGNVDLQRFSQLVGAAP